MRKKANQRHAKKGQKFMTNRYQRQVHASEAVRQQQKKAIKKIKIGQGLKTYRYKR